MPLSIENIETESANKIRDIRQIKSSYDKKKAYRALKRVFDFTISLLLTIVLMPVLVIVGFIVKLETPGPALFKQERVGRNGKVFVIYKFRTMRLDAPDSIAADQFADSNKYITKFGAFLRRTSIDELPQLINVLKGEMSLVGYRPLCLTEVKCNRLREETGVFLMRPGITGLAKVNGRDNVPYKEKVAIDTEYSMICGVLTDLKILIKTVKVVLYGEGVK